MNVAALRKRIETFPRSACPCCRSRLQLAKELLHVAAKLTGAATALPAGKRKPGVPDALREAGAELIDLASGLVDAEDGT